MVYVAQTFAAQQADERVVEILATIQPHMIPIRNTDTMAQTLQNELEARLDAAQFSAAWARGQSQDMGRLVTTLIAEPTRT